MGPARLFGKTLATAIGAGGAFAGVHFATVQNTTEANATDNIVGPSDPVSQSVVLGTLLSLGSFVSNALIDVRVSNREVLDNARHYRKPGQGLLTVCNHTSVLDEPVIIPCALVPLSEVIGDAPFFGSMMWSAGAADVMFNSAAMRWMSRNAKGIAVVRGGGVNQPGMDALVSKVSSGEWVNYFPEGKVVQNASGELAPFRGGFARLVVEPEVTPLVIPVVSSGMAAVKPVGMWPTLGKEVVVRIGDPVDIAPVVEKMKRKGYKPEQIRAEVIKVVEVAMNDEIVKMKKFAQTEREESLWYVEAANKVKKPIMDFVEVVKAERDAAKERSGKKADEE